MKSTSVLDHYWLRPYGPTEGPAEMLISRFNRLLFISIKMTKSETELSVLANALVLLPTTMIRKYHKENYVHKLVRP